MAKTVPNPGSQHLRHVMTEAQPQDFSNKTFGKSSMAKPVPPRERKYPQVELAGDNFKLK